MKGERGKVDENSVLLAKINPQKGKVLVFNHDSFHEGAFISKGTKYIVRTEGI